MKGKRKSTLYLFVCLTCLVNHNSVFAKQLDLEDIRFVNTSIKKIGSSLSEREKKVKLREKLLIPKVIQLLVQPLKSLEVEPEQSVMQMETIN